MTQVLRDLKNESAGTFLHPSPHRRSTFMRGSVRQESKPCNEIDELPFDGLRGFRPDADYAGPPVGPWQATVRNLSANGIGLIADRQFKRNMLLAVELPNAAPKLIRITHAQAQPGGKWWVFGGIFASSLSEEELGKLV